MVNAIHCGGSGLVGDRGRSMKPLRRVGIVVMALATTISFPPLVRAQSSGWESILSLYGFAASVDGDVSLGPVEAPVEANFGDVLENLQFAAQARYRGQSDRFSLVADFTFLAIGNSKDTGLVRRGDLDQVIFDVTGGYRFSPIAEVFAGLRVTELDAKLGLGDPLVRELTGGETFYDPVLGARVLSPLGADGKWWLQAHGDIGGFGAGMDFTWQTMANVGWKPTERISLWFGYRVLGQDFDEAGQAERFAMDVRLHGPQLGLGLHF
jgi:hypothetical protein